MEEEELMGVREAADALGLSERTVRSRLERGHMAGRKVGRDWVLTKREVERWRVRGRMRAPKTPRK